MKLDKYMTHWCFNSKFNDYELACGGRFAAIMYISQVARHRAKSVHNCITESQAISWVITGIEPESLKPNLAKWHKRRIMDILYAEDRLLYIEDKEVADAVRETVMSARKTNNLVYSYKEVCDESRKARVRILSQLIWDEMRHVRIEYLF